MQRTFGLLVALTSILAVPTGAPVAGGSYVGTSSLFFEDAKFKSPSLIYYIGYTYGCDPALSAEARVGFGRVEAKDELVRAELKVFPAALSGNYRIVRRMGTSVSVEAGLGYFVLVPSLDRNSGIVRLARMGGYEISVGKVADPIGIFVGTSLNFPLHLKGDMVLEASVGYCRLRTRVTLKLTDPGGGRSSFALRLDLDHWYISVGLRYPF